MRTQTHAEGGPREDREETAAYKPRREALEGTEPANTLISDFQPSERWENTFSLVHLDLWVLGAGVFLLLRLRLVKSEESIVELLSLFWDGASVIMTSVTWKAVCPELVPMRLSGKREDSKRVKKAWGAGEDTRTRRGLWLMQLLSFARSLI